MCTSFLYATRIPTYNIRFGPDALHWEHCSTIREYMRHGLMHSAGFHVVSGAILLAMSVFGGKSPVTFVCPSLPPVPILNLTPRVIVAFYPLSFTLPLRTCTCSRPSSHSTIRGTIRHANLHSPGADGWCSRHAGGLVPTAGAVPARLTFASIVYVRECRGDARRARVVPAWTSWN